MAIEISDAIPVQFWRPDCATWNQQEIAGVHKKKFCQKWNCADEIKIEFVDQLSDDSNFAEISFPALSAWQNNAASGSLIDWTTGATPSVDLSGGGPFAASEILYIDYDFTAGVKYKVRLNVTTDAATNIRIRTYDNSFTVYQSQNNAILIPATRVLEFVFTAGIYETRLGVSVFGSNAVVTINSRNVYTPIPDEYVLGIYDDEGAELQLLNFSSSIVNSGLNGLYRTSFIPSDYGICDEEILLKIIKSTGTPDVIVAVSDGLDIRTSHAETVLLTYTNHSNFAGIFYASVSPDQEFNIRIGATFFKKRMPQERESLQLSNNRMLSLYTQIKVQRYLITEPMPFYMQFKMGLVLSHQSVYIDQQYWVAEENYEVMETDRLSSLEKYNIWLTQKDQVVRNIL
jgi:hypothetical protein